ncbi:MAG: DUF2889 domain-containing protein [Desulfobacterales bacterium]|nr:DUF2889 domain-containing protein [Desulfobacterales bacterium]
MLEKRKGEKIHIRDIEISTYTCDVEGIIVEGILKDDRLTPYYTIMGESKPPSTIHHMIIRMLVNGQPLTIQDIEVEMPCSPREQCRETMEFLNSIKGMTISSGFTEKVKKTIGGNKGCAHLTTLVISMAAAAVQGFWSYYARKPISSDKVSLGIIKQHLVDTCWLWRKEGPFITTFNELSNKS